MWGGKRHVDIYPSLCDLALIRGHLTGGGVAGDEIDPRDLDRPLPATLSHLECHRECSCKPLSDAEYDQYFISTWMSPASAGPMESRHP